MKERLYHLFRKTVNSLNHPPGQKTQNTSRYVVLFTCLISLLLGISTYRSNILETPAPLTPITIPTSTKWWIQITPALSNKSSNMVITPKPADTSVMKCPPGVSSYLQPGDYAYVSLIPPLPNRVRSGAGKTYPYIGQIEPGSGVQIMDGPLCEDGFSWWLVESNDTSLRGWTAMGNGSEQWIISCTIPKTPCSKVPIIPATFTVTTQANDFNRCNSYMFTGGMFAQVKQSDLLVIRSEPYTGAVISYAAPGSKVKIIDGPSCTDGTIWWKVNVSKLHITGWTTEANLTPCSKEECP